jgi:hypothetical protein
MCKCFKKRPRIIVKETYIVKEIYRQMPMPIGLFHFYTRSLLLLYQVSFGSCADLRQKKFQHRRNGH